MTKQINKPTELTTTTTMMHGGAREGAGRMPLGTKPVMIRLTPLQQSILSSLGGSKYLRDEVLDRLADMAKDLAYELIEDSEGDYRSAIESMCGESIEAVVAKLPSDLSEVERKAVIETASWLLEKEHDEVGGNRYVIEVKYSNNLLDVSSVHPEDLEYLDDCYKPFECRKFEAQNDEEAQEIVEKAQDEADEHALRLLGIDDPHEARASEFYASSPKFELYRIAQFEDDLIDTYRVK